MRAQSLQGAPSTSQAGSRYPNGERPVAAALMQREAAFLFEDDDALRSVAQ